MAASTATTKASTHSRSISLPSNSHPLTATVEEHLCRLRTPEEASSSSLSTKCNKFNGLKDLYECVDDYLQLSVTQQNYSSCGEDVLCGSLRLLDLCSTTKDALWQIRVSIQDLESSLRRREVDVSSKVGSYLISKKKANKIVSQCFSNSKKLRNNKTTDVVGMLRDVEEVSISIFESIISSVCPSKAISKQNRWLTVFKSTQSKRVQCEEGREEDLNQVQKMDMALEALYKRSTKDNDILCVQEVQKCLMALDMNIQDCEEELNCLIRSLIKTRVSLLNVYNH